MEFFNLLAALYTPLKGRLFCIYGIVAFLLADDKGRHDLDEHGGICKGLGKHGKQAAHLIFRKVHGGAFHDYEDGRPARST